MAFSILWLDGQPFDDSLLGATKENFGKTKEVLRLLNGDFAISHRDVITAFDNPDFTGNAPGKWTASAYSTALLYKRLEVRGVKTAHKSIINANTTREEGLDMLPFEIIWRRYNVEGNSWEKRNPGKIAIGEKYGAIKYEACLKWSVINDSGEKIDDPFLLLDKNFEPLLRPDGMPRLMHPKEPNKEVEYTSVVHPNKWGNIHFDEVHAAVEQFKHFAGEIRQMTETVQETTFDTYAQIGRLNADGKIEVGLNAKKELVLGDELELDSLRNMSLEKIEIENKWKNITYATEGDLLGMDLHQLIPGWAAKILKIIKAGHSGKQSYRDAVKLWKETMMSPVRQDANDAAATRVTNTIYLPVAQALSDRFSGEVRYILRAV